MPEYSKSSCKACIHLSRAGIFSFFFKQLQHDNPWIIHLQFIFRKLPQYTFQNSSYFSIMHVITSGGLIYIIYTYIHKHTKFTTTTKIDASTLFKYNMQMKFIINIYKT